MRALTIASLILGLTASSSFADGHATGDAAEGEKLFKKCKSCHMVADGAGEVIVKGGKQGPNLYGLFDRAAGTQADFGKKYGKDLIAAGEAGLSWNEADFVSWLADPRGFLRTTLDDKKAKSKMNFRMKDATDAANVWAYLVSVGPATE